MKLTLDEIKVLWHGVEHDVCEFKNGDECTKCEIDKSLYSVDQIKEKLYYQCCAWNCFKLEEIIAEKYANVPIEYIYPKMDGEK